VENLAQPLAPLKDSAFIPFDYRNKTYFKIGQINGVKAVSPQVQLPIQKKWWLEWRNINDVNDPPDAVILKGNSAL